MLFVSLLVTPVTTGRKTREELGAEGPWTTVNIVTTTELPRVSTPSSTASTGPWDVPGMTAAFSFTVEPMATTATVFRPSPTFIRPENTGVRTVTMPVLREVLSLDSSAVPGLPPSRPGLVGGREVVIREEVVIPTFLVGSRPLSRVLLGVLLAINR